MITQVPSEPIKIGFDPEQAEEKKVRQVFADDLARSLWMMIKSVCLIVDKNFERWCLIKASEIRNAPPKSLEELHGFIRRKPPYSPKASLYLSEKWRDSEEWLSRLMQAINGSPIQFEISPRE